MKKTIIAGLLFSLLAGFVTLAQADIDIFLNDLDHQATADRHRYNTRLSNQFGISESRAASIVRSVDSPSHAFMLLQLGAMTGRPFDTVFNTYKRDRKKGWGAMAQQLGIKPGSAEFHALKRGDFIFSGKRGDKGWRHDDDWDDDHHKGRHDHDNDWNNDEDKGKGKDKDAAIDSETGKGKGKNKETGIDSETGKGKGKGKTK